MSAAVDRRILRALSFDGQATMRTATTDEHACRWFCHYWMLGVGSGAHALVNRLLDVVREEAETIGAASTAERA